MTIKIKRISLLIISLVCCLCMLFGIVAINNANAQNDKSIGVKKDFTIVLNDYTPLKTEGITKILDPNGYKVSHDGGKFMPLCVGEYKIYYGESYEIVQVLRGNPDVSFKYATEILSNYSTGDSFVLPVANIESVIGKYENYNVTITLDGQEIESLHSSDVQKGYSIIFERGGNYQITYSCTDSTSLKYTAKDVHNIVVSNEATLVMKTLPSKLFFGSSIDIGAVYGLYDGKTYPADVSVTLPSGEEETIYDIVYTPKKQGTYVFTASSNIDGQLKTLSQNVEVVISSGNLFSNAYSISEIKSGVDLPSYSVEKGKGVYIQAQTNSSSIYYSKIIDLKDFDKNDSLINFVPYSDGQSNKQDEIKVTLIDVHNINNQLTLKWWYKRSVSSESYMSVYLNGKEYGAINNEEIDDGDIRTYYGAIGWGCYFDAYNQGAKSRMFNLRFDYEENAVYSNLRNRWASEDKLFKIIDMDDADKIGNTNVWDGFTTGEVYLKIEFTSSQPISGVYIQSIAGEKLNKELLPDATNDTCFLINSEYEDLPDGVVNYFYPFPKVVKNILIDSEVSVTLKKGNDVVPSTEEGFTPQSVGEYTLVYSAVDNYGKISKKEFPFSVNQNTTPITIDILLGENIPLFTNYVIPDVTASGGSGNLKVEKKMLLDGKPLESFAGAYLIDTNGVYSVEVKVTDFLGYSVTERFELDIDNDYVSLTLEREILAVRAGQTVELPNFATYDFKEKSTPSKTLEVIANGNVIKTFSGNEQYSYNVPESYSELTLKYYSGKGTSREKILTKDVKVIAKNIDAISDFIIIEGQARALSLKDGMLYMAKDNAKIKFPNPVPVDGLSLVYGIDTRTVDNFNGFTIRLIDAINPDVVVEFRYYDINKNGSSKVEVNGDGKVYIAKYSISSYDSNSSYNAERKSYVGEGYYLYENYYDATLKKLNYTSGNEMASVSKLKDGRTFEGFASGLVFVEFEFNGVTTSQDYNSKILVKTVSNQNMTYTIERNANYVDNDNVGPELLFASKMVNSRTTINSEFVVSSAVAYDFIQMGSSYANVKVKDPSGNTIINEKLAESKKITLNKYGTYTIEYRAVDKLGTATTKTFNVVVYDNEAPSIIVNGTIKNEYNVGSTITLPSSTVADNYSTNLTAKVYIKTPSANYVVLTGKTEYTFGEKGSYLLVYSAEDAFGNLRRITYEITVK